jgi:hypothetical protein
MFGIDTMFLAAVVTIVLVYFWVVNVMITTYKNAFVSTLASVMIEDEKIAQSLGLSIHLIQKYSAKMVELHGTDFINASNFTTAEAKLLKAIIDTKVL